MGFFQRDKNQRSPTQRLDKSPFACWNAEIDIIKHQTLFITFGNFF